MILLDPSEFLLAYFCSHDALRRTVLSMAMGQVHRKDDKNICPMPVGVVGNLDHSSILLHRPALPEGAATILASHDHWKVVGIPVRIGNEQCRIMASTLLLSGGQSEVSSHTT